MSLLDTLRDLSHRSKILRLDALARGVQLLNLRSESPRGNFVFPGTDYLDAIEVAGQRVGQVDYGINPLQDRVYINMIDITPARQGMASAWACSGSYGARTKCQSCRCTSTPHPMDSGTGRAGVLQRPAPCSRTSCAAARIWSWNKGVGSTWCPRPRTNA